MKNRIIIPKKRKKSGCQWVLALGGLSCGKDIIENSIYCAYHTDIYLYLEEEQQNAPKIEKDMSDLAKHNFRHRWLKND